MEYIFLFFLVTTKSELGNFLLLKPNGFEHFDTANQVSQCSHQSGYSPCFSIFSLYHCHSHFSIALGLLLLFTFLCFSISGFSSVIKFL